MNSLEIKSFRKKYRLTQSDLADLLGVTITTVKSWEYNQRNISKSSVKVIENYIQSIENNKSKVNSIPEDDNLLVDVEYLPPSTNIKIPYYDVDFAGGWTTEELFSHQNPLFIITNPAFDRSDFACNLYGDSVSERIPSGAVIGLKKIEDWQTYFITDSFYGVITKNDLRTVKLVYRSKTDKTKLILKSCPKGKESIEEEIPIDFIATFFQLVAWEKFERLVN